MNSTKEDLDRVVKLVLLILLWFFPIRWQSIIFPSCTLCYVKGELPLTASGEIDLANLNQMNWEMLPIDLLWPHILNNPAVAEMLVDHCREFEYKQIFWIGKFDPLNRAILLTNEQCMKQINWANLELDDYINHLPELEIQNIANLIDLSDELIYYALSRINFSFSSLNVHCDFIERLPLRFLSNSKVLKNPTALNLFNVNCLLGANHLAKPFSDFLLNMRPSSYGYYWKYQLTELEDFAKTFPIDTCLVLENCQRALINSEYLLLTSNPSPTFELGIALQSRDYDYVTTLDLQNFKTKFGLGPFDQFRLILILLGRNDLEAFIKYFEMNLFDHWVILKVLQIRPEIADWLYTADIPCQPLLRLLSLHPPEISIKIPPFSIPKASEIKNTRQLSETLRYLIPRRFPSRNFRIELADEAVVDLGGPLLDWITRILQLFLDFGLFAAPENFEAEAQIFLEPELFKFLGLLHGKLVQIGTGPCWLPAIHDEIIQNIKSLVTLKNNSEEAVRLFNDFRFPSLIKPHASSHKVKDMTEISAYLVKLEKCFECWKILAWENYFVGLRYFFNSKVPRQLIKKVLIPSEPPTISGLLALSTVEANEAVPYNLQEIWEQILASFSIPELSKLLLFITGQCRPVPISIYFHIFKELRFPQSRTCFKHLFLYCPHNLPDPEALAEWLTQALKTSIENYEGFGNI